MGSGNKVDFSSYAAQAANPGALADTLNGLLMHGAMSSDMKNSIVGAMHSVPAGNKQSMQEAQIAIYLAASSSQYQVQH
jgi:hypothetical protein